MEIKTIPNKLPAIDTEVTLTTSLHGICPESDEPKIGSSISVTYRPKESLIELHAIELYLKDIQKGSEPLDLETLIQMIAMDCHLAVGWVKVIGNYILLSGIELKCICRIP